MGVPGKEFGILTFFPNTSQHHNRLVTGERDGDAFLLIFTIALELLEQFEIKNHFRAHSTLGYRYGDQLPIQILIAMIRPRQRWDLGILLYFDERGYEVH